MLLEAVSGMENVPKNAIEGEQRTADACLAQLVSLRRDCQKTNMELWFPYVPKTKRARRI